ncbi:ABC transporter ATP-binding protein [Haliangium ochraceum]|uniref:ABC transporter related protein n=1 Tax=Haliangium ochraceum (strain DSM 14365 / JCM 11303 / SMP-2) TaxID=502025 RepID=D0LV39_HALO1|nr:ABC transporter ATP-binding protein [Haliangium ochraceum]ACY15880.1 ABC transporter related protein [Haliangium ochraceum DSM 14365]
MHEVLTVRGARKRYGEVEALRGADLALRRGHWVGLLGPNGAGKTTLVRAIAGRVRLDAGELTLLGSALRANNRAARVARRRMGVVPQDLALYERLTARENLAVFGRFHGVTGKALRERMSWALAWIGLAERGDHRVGGFSGGMKRRLNIACSVLHRPDVLLLDEPTVGVDPQSRQRIWDMLEELRRAGTSLLLTTHHLDEAQQVCEDIVIIDHGRVIASGTVETLIAQTLGTGRSVSLALDPAPSPEAVSAAEETLAAAGIDDLVRHGHLLRCTAGDVANALPALLRYWTEAGHSIGDLEVSPPSLHTVFLHLTGQELRE